jgi:hypothetical protein
MHIPDEPPIGNLVAYEYLWLSQENTREDGAKVYPVAIIFAKKSSEELVWSDQTRRCCKHQAETHPHHSSHLGWQGRIGSAPRGPKL